MAEFITVVICAYLFVVISLVLTKEAHAADNEPLEPKDIWIRFLWPVKLTYIVLRTLGAFVVAVIHSFGAYVLLMFGCRYLYCDTFAKIDDELDRIMEGKK